MQPNYRISLFLALLLLPFTLIFAQDDSQDAPSGFIAYVAPTGIVGGGELRLLNVTNATSIRLSPENDNPRDIAPRFSPDGNRIAFISDGKLAFTTPNGEDVIITDIESTRAITWASDNSQVAFLTPHGDDYQINIYSIATGENRIYDTPDILKSHDTPSWSTDGAFIIYSTHTEAGTSTDILRISADFNPETLINLSNTDDISEIGASISPNGSFISYKGWTDDIWVMDIQGDNRRNLTEGRLLLGAVDAPILWSPDSTRVMVADAGRGIAIINILTGDITDFEGENPTWSPNGQWVAYTRFSENRDGIAYSDLYIAPVNNPRDGRVLIEDVASAGLSWQPDPSLTFESVSLATPTPSATATPSVPQAQIEAVLAQAQQSSWYFDGDADANLTIIAQSDAFDTVIQLFAPNGELLAENDDFDHTNSQIDTTLSQDGVYQVVVSAFYGDASGAYTLTVIGIEGSLREKPQGGRFIATAIPTPSPTNSPTHTPTLRPTLTPTPTETFIPTITPSPTFGFDRSQCPANLLPRLEVNARGRVLPGGSSTVYDQPVANSTALGEIPGGVSFTVLEGPVCTDNRIWWQVEYRDITGWVIEAGNGEYFLEPLRR